MNERKILTREIFTTEVVDSVIEHMEATVYELYKNRRWQLRTVEEKRFPFEEVMIFGNKVSFLLTDLKIIIYIHHQGIAQSMTSIFDALWLTGQPSKFA